MTVDLSAFFKTTDLKAVMGVIGLGLSTMFFLLSRKTKGIAYRIIRNDKVIRQTDSFRGRVKILLDDQVADDLSLLLIEIQNSGSEPLKIEDFQKPLSFSFKEPARVISVQVRQREEENIDATALVKSDTVVELQPLLLNSGDRVNMEILISQLSGEILHSARIVGVRKVKRLNAPDELIMIMKNPWFGAILLPILCVGAFGQAWFARVDFMRSHDYWRWVVYPAFGSLISVFLVNLSFTMAKRWIRKN